LKEYHLTWRTVPLSGSVYYKGVLTIKANSFDEAVDEAERIIRAKPHQKFRDVPLQIIQKGQVS